MLFFSVRSVLVMLRFLLALLLLSLVQPSYADERAATRQQIEQAKKDIAELKQRLKKTQSEKSTAQRELQKTEQEIGALETKVRQLEAELKKNQQELEQLNQEAKTLQIQRQQQQKLIAIQGRAAYQAGQQEPLRLFLNQQQPGHANHNLTYYQYMHNARSEQIDTYNKTITQLAELQSDIRQQQQQIENQKNSLLTDKQQLAELKQQRQQRVKQLNQQQSQQQQQISSKEKDQQELNKVLATIEATLAKQAQEEKRRLEQAQAIARQQQQNQIQNQLKDGKHIVVSSSFSHPGGNFDKARGKLAWPVSGPLIARFGTPRGDSRSLWDGVLIQAPEGTQVKAIHPGRVVFADWLRGAGMLIIVDHGGGYLTLYGHNQSLLSSAGDTVKAGQVIATVGNTGGQAQSALYFAIRKQGKATDPNQWCRT